MRGIILSLLVVLASACNAPDSSTSGEHNLPGKQTGIAFAAHTPTIRFSGSCAIHGASGTPLICQDFWNRPGSELENAERVQCVVSGSKWADDACSEVGRYGGCKSKTDENGAYVVQWFYVEELGRAGKEACIREGASVWME